MRLYFMILIIIVAILSGCNSESSTIEKPVSSKNIETAKKQTAKKQIAKKQTANEIWEQIQTDLSLTNRQIISAKRIERKFQKKYFKLKKDGLWVGTKNSENRKSFNQEKTKEIKKILKNKTASYTKLKADLTK